MKILAVADEPAGYFYDYYTPGKLNQYELILACGDLKPKYLEFLVTMAHCPLIYVRGNHDDEQNGWFEPEGCDCAEDRIINYKGVRILGLGGSIRYNDRGYMFTQKDMNRRVRKLTLPLKFKGGFDILLTHSPAYRINDMDSPTHCGFQAFVPLLEQYRPKAFVHGHIHTSYGVHIPRETDYHGTKIINACGYYEFEV